MSIVGALILLFPCTVTDIRKKEIPAVYVLGFTAVAFLINILSGHVSWINMLFGCGIGAVFFLISLWTKEQIGYGDDMMILAVGVWLGGTMLTEIMTFSFLSASLVSIILLIISRKNKGRRLPFAPFLTFGTAICLILQAVNR